LPPPPRDPVLHGRPAPRAENHAAAPESLRHQGRPGVAAMTCCRRGAHTPTGITALQTNPAGPTRHSTPTLRGVVSWGFTESWRVTCGCRPDCWCKKPVLSTFRWAIPAGRPQRRGRLLVAAMARRAPRREASRLRRPVGDPWRLDHTRVHEDQGAVSSRPGGDGMAWLWGDCSHHKWPVLRAGLPHGDVASALCHHGGSRHPRPCPGFLIRSRPVAPDTARKRGTPT